MINLQSIMLQKEIIENAYPALTNFAANDKRLIIKITKIVSSIRERCSIVCTIKIGIKRKKSAKR